MLLPARPARRRLPAESRCSSPSLLAPVGPLFAARYARQPAHTALGRLWTDRAISLWIQGSALHSPGDGTGPLSGPGVTATPARPRPRRGDGRRRRRATVRRVGV